MTTPEEKAKYLISINTLAILSVIGNKLPMVEVKEIAKQSALIAVDEILNHHSQEQGLYRIDTYYWQEVKQEIEKL